MADPKVSSQPVAVGFSSTLNAPSLVRGSLPARPKNGIEIRRDQFGRAWTTGPDGKEIRA